MAGEKLVVADTGHHRILVLNKGGIILNVIGGGVKKEAGFVDGSFQEARFHSPQGVTLEKQVIYVADTENHAIRKVRKFLFLFILLLVFFMQCSYFIVNPGVQWNLLYGHPLNTDTHILWTVSFVLA